jgi:hypothetical protein
MKFSSVQKTALLLFLGLSAAYTSLSPASIVGQGYASEEMDSGMRILSVATAWMKGNPVPPMIWSRHGPVPLLFDLPFLKFGKLLVSPDFMLSFQPALLTAASVTILFLWLRKLCSPGMCLFLSLTAAFGTMLWPYAYISLETKQSLFVFLAGYLALSAGKIRSWPRFLLFAISCALALSLKTTGIVLWPVIAYLTLVQFHGDWRERRSQLLVLIFIVGAVWTLGHWGSNQYWSRLGGGAASFRLWLIDSPLQFFINLIGVFGSPNKGFFIYAPVMLASLYAVPRALRTHRPIAIFALLVLGCTLGLICLLTSPTDEVWGPRYMHTSIAPLMVCIGAAFPRFEWRRDAVLVALAVIGVAISFLGTFYYYGVIDFAATKEGQNVMEWLTGDSSWNPIEFDTRLLRVWLFDRDSAPVLWTPKHTWLWTPPPGALLQKSIDLREYCQPQSFLLRFWRLPKEGRAQRIFVTYEVSLALGVLLLIWVVLRTANEQRAAHGVDEFSKEQKETHARI